MFKINQRGPKSDMQPVLLQQLAIAEEIRIGAATDLRCADEKTWPGHQYLLCQDYQTRPANQLQCLEILNGTRVRLNQPPAHLIVPARGVPSSAFNQKNSKITIYINELDIFAHP
ncbi:MULTISPECIES: hypothetical protein [Pseudomonas syringae group]|uniref:hypothetical protein n=1 Tax=Pseudomonas syringae group TaxID=136849 RepID=UPI000EFF5D7D|nr:hypothetical protein [Pseudomonas syringae group genomosp. 3]